MTDWNGVSWSEVADLSTARMKVLAGRCWHIITSGLAFGGGTPGATTAVTEEWSGSSNTIKVLTD